MAHDKRADRWWDAIERNAQKPGAPIGISDAFTAIGIPTRRLEQIFNERSKVAPTPAEAKQIREFVDNLPKLNTLFIESINNDRSQAKSARIVRDVVHANVRTKTGRRAIADAMIAAGVPASGPKALYLKGRGGGRIRKYMSGAQKRSRARG